MLYKVGTHINFKQEKRNEKIQVIMLLLAIGMIIGINL